MVHQRGWVPHLLFLISVLSFLRNSYFFGQAFHVLGTQRQPVYKNRWRTPVMTVLPESGTAKKKNGQVAVDNFDFDRWQAGGVTDPKSRLTSFSQTCFAEYWHDLPSISSDVDSEKENCIDVVDPYDFRHRMALEKYLIEHTGGESIWGAGGVTKCSKHPRWGYAAQLDWQYRSGRLEDPSNWQDSPFDGNPKSNKISKRSWWGFMNSCFSVACYCGAAEAGLVPSVSLSDESLANNVGFQACVGIWKKFWENDHVALLSSLPNTKDEEERLTAAMYRALWATHTDIIRTALQHSEDLRAILPEGDRDVGLGWCNMVELLSATNWPLLSLDTLCKFGGGFLPSVRLAGPRTLEWMKANREMEYTTVKSLYQLMDTPETTMNIACQFFSRLSKWNFARNNLPRTLHVLTHGNPIQKTLALSRILLLVAFPRS